MTSTNILTVSEVNKYIKDMISRDGILSGLWVKGEISNFKNHYSGHFYFSLKDEKSVLKCVMFRSNASLLPFVPEDGMKVIIRGYVSVFERDGQYQLYAEEIQPDGIGALYIAFEKLKKKLEAEGLFDAAKKKKLPYLPKAIGVVTSSTGAVIRDIINVLSRRFYNFNLKLYPVQVQGEQAAGQIAAAVRRFNELDNVDVIIVARGGGSLEDLWPFNEEIVARSIYESRIPVISAVGHETDFTIADFVADVRAPTPSAAAELVMPERAVVENRLDSLKLRLRNAVMKKTAMERLLLRKIEGSVAFRQPLNKIYQERMLLDVQKKYMQKALSALNTNYRNKLSLLAATLDTLSPLKSLARGYSITKSKKDGSLVRSVHAVSIGDRLEINLMDGRLGCTVESIEEDSNG
ncbi:MAG TPA: exodeoxyribonuclease VII large subunit [Clostridiales bacterium]|nr:exodeoxyribonuclease VII large subunit [Clostridiales bacterium]HOL90880.1 exodeoxyribonuclease VII large subunit [Clostridiales bacterium]HPP35214.1 exodeoxyribonuclease VII large subunit [Clostridiales bacterium]